MESVLSLKEYGVAFGERIILSSVSLDIPERGVVVFLGPSGTGKSTLLRTIAGCNDASPSLRTWGGALYAGNELGTGDRPVLVAQKARLMLANIRENLVNDLPERHSLTRAQQTDIAKRLLSNAGLPELIDKLEENVVSLPLGAQRYLAIIRTIAANPRLILIDEPTTGLDAEYSNRILNYIISESSRRAIMVVVHNQNHARHLGGNAALLAGGWIHEFRKTEHFLASPDSQAAKDFIRTGSCNVPAPDTPEEHLEPAGVEMIRTRPEFPKAAHSYKSDAFGPRNFLWLERGVLAGTPRPGLFLDLAYDLNALKRVGVSVLVSLTTTPIDPEALAEYNIKGISFPIKDMGAPDVNAAMELCRQVETLIQQGEAVALHCKAGLGRTGTMLACQLIWRGYNALDALEKVRHTEPRWVQSEEQIDFLSVFAQAITNLKPQKTKHP